MAFITKDQILSVEDLEYEEIDIPAWGGKVRLRCLTGTERDSFESSIYKIKGDSAEVVRDNFRANLVARCLVDENGERLFTDKEANELGKKNSRVINKLFEVAQRLNALTIEDEEAFVKNSRSEEENGSISSSPKS